MRIATALLCALLSHIATPHVSRNQGFDFSTCQRCARDMIRSAEPRASKWKPVPTGFRVIWRNTDPDQQKRSAARHQQEKPAHSSLILDFLYVTTAALYWNISDYLSRTVQHREVILRLESL